MIVGAVGGIYYYLTREPENIVILKNKISDLVHDLKDEKDLGKVKVIGENINILIDAKRGINSRF